MTTTTRADSNGSKQKLTGMARIQEADTWRTASVMHDAAFEAERLCDQIYRMVTDAYQPQGDSTAAQIARSGEIAAKSREAQDCMRLAMSYLETLTGGEPSF